MFAGILNQTHALAKFSLPQSVQDLVPNRQLLVPNPPHPSSLYIGIAVFDPPPPTLSLCRTEGSTGQGERLQPSHEGLPHRRTARSQQPGGDPVLSGVHLWPLAQDQDHVLPCAASHIPGGGHLPGPQHPAAQGMGARPHDVVVFI